MSYPSGMISPPDGAPDIDGISSGSSVSLRSGDRGWLRRELKRAGVLAGEVEIQRVVAEESRREKASRDLLGELASRFSRLRVVARAALRVGKAPLRDVRHRERLRRLSDARRARRRQYKPARYRRDGGQRPPEYSAVCAATPCILRKTRPYATILFVRFPVFTKKEILRQVYSTARRNIHS